MRLSKDEIVAVVLNEIQQATGVDSDTMSTKRQLALDYYNKLLPAVPMEADEETGELQQIRSGIVSGDVADCVHSLMAQVQPIVKTTSIELEPENEQDEPQAQAESDFTRKIIEQRKGYKAMFSACHDALLIGNGWIKVENEEVTETIEYKYPLDLPNEAQALSLSCWSGLPRVSGFNASSWSASQWLRCRLNLSVLLHRSLGFSFRIFTLVFSALGSGRGRTYFPAFNIFKILAAVIIGLCHFNR